MSYPRKKKKEYNNRPHSSSTASNFSLNSKASSDAHPKSEMLICDDETGFVTEGASDSKLGIQHFISPKL